jgi:glutaredoxin
MGEIIEIYSKPNCPQCLQAESLAKLKGKAYTVLKLDVDYTREGLEAGLKARGAPAPRSFPVIIKGDFVGDLNSFKVAIMQGKL